VSRAEPLHTNVPGIVRDGDMSSAERFPDGVLATLRLVRGAFVVSIGGVVSSHAIEHDATRVIGFARAKHTPPTVRR
jgi:hypothetical protein